MKLFLFFSLVCFSVAFSQTKQERFMLVRDLFSRHAATSLASSQNNLGLPATTKKSVPLAVALSFLVPGLGEWYAGNFSSGKYFLLAEGGLWLTYAGFDQYGTWVRNDARQYAKVNAGVSLEGKDEKYFVNIGNFMSVDEYNHTRLINRQSEKMYLPSSEYYWKWKTQQQRLTYRSLRINSDLAFNNLKFIGIGIGLNHLASAINAALSASSYNRNALSYRLEFHPDIRGFSNQPPGLSVTFRRIL
jgi:TM2 domain-containing membrane protein YozV